MERSAITAGSYSDFALFRRLLSQARPYWPHLGGVFVLSLLSTPLALLTPVPLKIAVDSAIGSEPLPGFLEALMPEAVASSGGAVLALAVGLIVAIALLRELQKLASSLLRTYVGQKLILSFRAQLFRHAQRLSLSYHDSRGTTDTAYRIQHDVGAIRGITVDGIVPLTTAAFTLVGMIYVTAQIQLQLALVALVALPFLFLTTWVYSQRLRGR